MWEFALKVWAHYLKKLDQVLQIFRLLTSNFEISKLKEMSLCV